jgi:uncharacterized protein YgiM (DUF1202 family)
LAHSLVYVKPLTNHKTTPYPGRELAYANSRRFALLVLVVVALTAVALSGCGPAKNSPSLTPAERDAQILAIADQFAASNDLSAATSALAELDLDTPAPSVLALAESYIAQNGEPQMTRNLVLLAQALGPLSRMASEYLATMAGGEQAVAVAAQPEPPKPTATPVPPTDTPTSVPPTDTPTATQTPEPTATPTTTPVPRPQVVADRQGLNVRGGPDTVYPVIGEMAQGETADITGRNAEGSWWQVTLANGREGWVAASLVTATGPADAVEIAANIPAAPPTATPRPAAAAAPPPAAPTAQPAAPSGPPFVFASYRLRAVGEHAQSCTGGDHAIWVTVVDAAGNPLNGVRVREIYTGQVQESGSSGPGMVHFDIYRGGGGVVEIVDGNNSAISPQSPGMSADWPPFDLMNASGYCNCKPHPDPASCRADLESKNYFFAVGHYVYEVVFKRQS